jgi:TRAP-type mannitol/chloroaromatic compound transport system permease large subunit
MSAVGLVMFAVALVAIVATGLPVYAVLLAVAAVFAALGVALGAFDAALLGALPFRLVGLLEHDLLQALPLYALIGALLNRLPLAATLHRAGCRLLARTPAAAELSALGVAALLAPMNGSVGASLHTLSRRVAPALLDHRMPPARAVATLCVAGTLGVVIPPSLVLLLLGDAMMRAHTEAVNATHAAVRIVNTQDVMRAALPPGLAVLAIACALALWRARRAPRAPLPPLARGEAVTALAVAAFIATLLAGVAVGWFYAVEAAAAGGVLLALAAAVTRQLDTATLRAVLRDTMALTGALFALLVGATTFSLVLRAWGTDRLVGDLLGSLATRPTLLLGAVLAGMAACTLVLDAFEMIFLVVPLVMPPVLMAVDDAAWVAALTLLVLQAGFLLPPLGYAVVMSRSLLPVRPGTRALARALAPQLAGQALLVAAVLALPGLTRWGRAEPGPAPDDAQIDRLMQEAIDAQRREQRAPESPRP